MPVGTGRNPRCLRWRGARNKLARITVQRRVLAFADYSQTLKRLGSGNESLGTAKERRTRATANNSSTFWPGRNSNGIRSNNHKHSSSPSTALPSTALRADRAGRFEMGCGPSDLLSWLYFQLGLAGSVDTTRCLLGRDVSEARVPPSTLLSADELRDGAAANHRGGEYIERAVKRALRNKNSVSLYIYIR